MYKEYTCNVFNFVLCLETLRPQNCSQIKEHYPESETGIHTIYKNNLKANGRQVACNMSGEGKMICIYLLANIISYLMIQHFCLPFKIQFWLFFIGVELPTSCSDILQSEPSATNGIYKIFVEPSTIADVYCDMSDQGKMICFLTSKEKLLTT